jgi:hypothetical protein
LGLLSVRQSKFVLANASSTLAPRRFNSRATIRAHNGLTNTVSWLLKRLCPFAMFAFQQVTTLARIFETFCHQMTSVWRQFVRN